MNKKKFLISLFGAILLILGLGMQTKSAQASTITLKATSKRAYYNVKPGRSKVDYWTDNSGVDKYIRINHGKFYIFVPMTYVVRGKKAVYDVKAMSDKKGYAAFKKGHVYIVRFPLHISHLKPGQKYRFRSDFYPEFNDYAQYHWVTKRANKKGVIYMGPRVDIYLNCRTSKKHMRYVMKHKTRISNSRIYLM